MKHFLAVIVLSVIFVNLPAQEKFTDIRDGNSYRTITYDGITWMAENLKFKLPEGAVFYDNNINNLAGYGMLYDWNTAMDACPTGWHLPSGREFHDLSSHYEQKESWRFIKSDSTSFGIQLGGMQDYEGTFSELDESGYYWTSTEYGKNNSEYFSYLIIDEMPVIDISRKADIADIHGTEKSNKYSVRCVKN